MFFEYQIKYFDELLDTEAEQSGFVYGRNFTEVIGTLEDYYGIDNVCEINHLAICSEVPLITTNDLLDTKTLEGVLHANDI